MSDARSLLRQQREARRITHAHASYSDAGKLLCTACREPVKTETLWDSHIQSESHRKRIALLEQQQKPQQSQLQKETPAAATTTTTTTTTTAKRKHQDDEDEDMRDGETQDDRENDDDDSASAQARSRRKRSRPDLSDSDSLKDMSHTPPPPPPSMTRRSSGTPSQGIELQIPSRPATPRGTSSSSTTNGGSTHSTTLPSRQASTLIPGPPLKPIATATAGKQQDQQQTAAPAAAQAVDEDEWAAFEADMAATEYAAEATISAPAMTNEEAEAAERAKAEAADDGGDPRKRTTQREADLQGEKEDAQRALEEEFDEMQSLEAKVTKLKQQRDALKQRAASHGGHEGGKPQQRPVLTAEKENEAVVEEDEDEDESDEDEDDGWDGFRFRTGVAGRS